MSKIIDPKNKCVAKAKENKEDLRFWVSYHITWVVDAWKNK
jgi:hypothetical protein